MKIPEHDKIFTKEIKALKQITWIIGICYGILLVLYIIDQIN